MHISALLYDHLYNTVFAELNCEDERAVGSSYADFGATIDGNCRNGVNMNFHEGIEKQSHSASSAHLPLQVQQSLDPNIYRNVALEVWEQSKQDQKHSDLALAVELQFKMGDECLLRFPGANSEEDFVRARIIGLAKESGSYNVFVPDYKENYCVPVESLRPLLETPKKASQISYTELPGYYKKSEEFQYQKTKNQKGKSNSNSRDEEVKWKRNDIRYDSRSEGKSESRPENRIEAHGHRYESRREKRGVVGDKVKWDKNVRKGKASEKSVRNASKVSSPVPSQQKNENKPEKKREKSPDDQECSDVAKVSSNSGCPILKAAQQQENTAKQDETPAAFWKRMRKDNKPPSGSPSDLEKAVEMKPTQSSTDVSNTVENPKRNKVIDTNKKSNPNKVSFGTHLYLPNSAKSLSDDNSSELAAAKATSTFSDEQSQNSSENLNVKASENVSLTLESSLDSALKRLEQSTNRQSLDSVPCISESSAQISSRSKLGLDSNNCTAESIDTCLGSESVKVIDTGTDSKKLNEDTQDTKSKEHEVEGQGVNGRIVFEPNISAPHGYLVIKNASEIASNAFSVAIGARNCSTEHAVSFPTGFDAPIECSVGRYSVADDIASSNSSLTFMSSHSEIPLGSVEDSSENGHLDSENATSLSPVCAVPEVAEPTELFEKNIEQKNEQKIRILRKDNKDQFVYFTPPNEGSLPVEPPASLSRDVNPEQETRKTAVKKVSFGNVTEILQLPTVVEPFVTNNVQSATTDFLQKPYGNTNGICEPQDQHYFGVSNTFDTPIRAPMQMTPVMMYPFPQPTEQIHIPQGYSVDPGGKDLPVHIATVQYFFNLGLQAFYMHTPPQGFYNIPVHQLASASIPVQPQPIQNPAVPHMPPQRFPLDSSSQHFPREQQDEFIAISSATPFSYDVTHHQAVNQVRQPHASQNNSNQYEQPPRMRRGRGRVGNLGSQVSASHGYVHNHVQHRQQQFRLSKRGFPVNLQPQHQPSTF